MNILNNSRVYGVILAGGSGTRLWPLSKSATPKQVIPFGNTTLLQLALDRLHGICPAENRIVVTTIAYQQAVLACIGETPGRILVEPMAKNTTAAIALACYNIQKQDPKAILVFIPADHTIDTQTQFIDSIHKALTIASEQECITLIGIKPTHPATGYGYIEFAGTQVLKFHEKPNLAQALKYSAQENILWNCGIFCAQVTVFTKILQQLTPELYAAVVAQEYATITPASFDTAVMEKALAHGIPLAVVPAEFTWSDVGTLDTFLAARANVQMTNALNVRATNNIKYGGKKLTVFLGVEDLYVIETENTLLVTRQGELKNMQDVIAYLHEQGHHEYV